MSRRARPITILIAEDDQDDRMLIEDAFLELKMANEIRFVGDGEELLEYLRREGRYAGSDAPRPGIILLDLNMPRMDGREALQEIKGDTRLHNIPVIVLTTSKAEEDVLKTYGLGVNSFITKPVTFTALVDIVRTITSYWIEIVELPPECRNAA